MTRRKRKIHDSEGWEDKLLDLASWKGTLRASTSKAT